MSVGNRRRDRAPDSGVLLVGFLLFGAPAPAESTPVLDHVGLECISPNTFAVVLSGIDPWNEIVVARVYFRSSLYPDFYYVNMERHGDRYEAILPRPSPTTPRVVYYVEAADSSFQLARSLEFDPLVTDPCDSDPHAVVDPEIIVGATTAGASPLPPGFGAAGIAGTIALTGVVSSVGGGVGAGVVIAAGAGAAGAAGVVVATNGGDGTTTTAAASGGGDGSTTTTASGGGTTTTPGPATTTTTPGPATTTTAPGPTTTTTSPGPVTTTTAPETTTTTTSVPPTTTTSPPTTTSTSGNPLNAGCFSVEILATCQVRLHGTCVNLPVDEYDWVLDEANVWQRVDPASTGDTFTFKWVPPTCGNDAVLTFRLTVRRGAQTNTATKSVLVPGDGLLRVPPRVSPAKLRMTTHLALPPEDGTVRGRVLLDGRLAGVVDSSGPRVIEKAAALGVRRVEAVVGRPGIGPGIWRFDLSGSDGVVAGSLRVSAGTTVSLEPTAVVFRLTGEPLERVAFEVELAP